ncbi:synaptotagmin-10-like [Rhopilema esculentum]|uniref:synaptotagmin-10-like n=1 Tax=Rhopilema esculentum TaxID=499914 RepID=UPI0031E1FC3C
MTRLQDQGTFGVVLLVLLIVLSVCLVIISLVTCYLYNIFNCYERFRRLRRVPETVTHNNSDVGRSSEVDAQTRSSGSRLFLGKFKKSIKGEAKSTSPKLPILHISEIEKQQYRRKPRPDSAVLLGQGRLTFALKYVRETELLHVHLINGRQITLPSGELARLPVVKLRINDAIEDERQSSPDDTPNPEFDEVVSFRLQEDSLGVAVLHFTIWDSDLNMFKALVGFIRVPLVNFVDSLLRPSGTGPLTREINLNPDKDLPSRNNGEILISLSYTAEDDKFIVAVLKCRDLTTEDDVTELFVAVSLCANANLISQQNTKCVEKSDNVTFNEMLAFGPSMTNKHLTKNNVSINISIKARTLTDEEFVLGEAKIGPNTTEEGILHWKEMITYSRTAVAQWHRLIF